MKKMIKTAVDVLSKGGVICYPTEAVFGLGCDPYNESAVKKILSLKQRDIKKGLILIAASWQQCQPFINSEKISLSIEEKVLKTWPGPVTWLFPVSSQVPPWIKGQHESIALRVTAHPLAKAICEKYGHPIVSTSANLAENPAARTYQEVEAIFGEKIDYLLKGLVGDLSNPTEIRDAITDQIIR